jgi:hypothetical protein
MPHACMVAVWVGHSVTSCAGRLVPLSVVHNASSMQCRTTMHVYEISPALGLCSGLGFCAANGCPAHTHMTVTGTCGTCWAGSVLVSQICLQCAMLLLCWATPRAVAACVLHCWQVLLYRAVSGQSAVLYCSSLSWIGTVPAMQQHEWVSHQADNAAMCPHVLMSIMRQVCGTLVAVHHWNAAASRASAHPSCVDVQAAREMHSIRL